MESLKMTNPTDITTAACCGETCDTAQSVQRSAWSYTPAIDVYEMPDAYFIACDAPGVKAEAIELTYESGVLHLHGEVPLRSTGSRFLRHEYGVGDFDREIPLGRLAEFVDGENATAEYAHGVLSIRLPKLAAAQPRRIEVNKKSV
jgi:HSP20 family protein